MVSSPLLGGLAKSIVSALNRLALAKRWAYSFDGVDDRGALQFRAINPDGDIDIEFRTGPVVPAAGGSDYVVVSQCLTSVYSGASGKEFTLYFNAGSGALQCLHGGNFLPTATGAVIAPNKKYRWRMSGTVQTAWVDDVQVFNGTTARGLAREPQAVTVIAAQTHGNASTFRGFSSGIFYDVKINGVLYPMADRNQPIQLPSPSGLGAELMTPSVLANPGSKGAQWTYLGDGRWQLTGDGTYNELILLGVQPRAYVLEFEIESISGGSIRCFSNSTQTASMSQHLFNSVGKHRFVLTGPIQGAYQSFVRHGGNINCVIKNISLKPLVSAYGGELVTNGNFSSAAGWNLGAGAAIANGELQINSPTVTGANRTVATVNERVYEITFTIKSISSGSVRAILYGSGTQYVGPNRNAVGTYTELITFNALGGSFNNVVSIQGGHVSSTVAVIDDVSVREVTGYCNPLTLTNTTSDRWQEVPL